MRVVYVAGWLRSGTTLLGRLLGGLPGAFALGELSGIWAAAAHGDRCSCGQPLPECPVWAAGLAAVAASHGVGQSDLAEFASLTRSVLRTRDARRLAALVDRPQEEWPESVRTYVNVVNTLLHAVAKFSGAEFLVDSSKLPPGFLTLMLVPDVRVDVIQIIRDPRAVVNSEGRSLQSKLGTGRGSPPGRSTLRSSFYWSTGNLAVQMFGRHADSFVQLRYEALTADPAGQLRLLASGLQVPEPPGGLELGGEHLAVGNPSRFETRREVKPDIVWRTELSAPRRLLVSVATAPARWLLRSQSRPCSR